MYVITKESNNVSFCVCVCECGLLQREKYMLMIISEINAREKQRIVNDSIWCGLV